jgi:Tfp pilus assembly protein PilN
MPVCSDTWNRWRRNHMAIHVPINLASEPFRRDRALLVASAVLGIALVALLGWQISAIVHERHQAAAIRITINQLSAQLRTVSTEQAKLNTTLRKPENAEVLERSLFLNTLIERKAISWSKIFADLEKVLPYNVRLVSVRLPEVDSENAVLLDMLVGAKEVQPVLDLLRKLEASPQFGAPEVPNSMPPSQTDPYFRYHVSVRYAQKF